ncbi:DJ-1 family protein [Clostridium pasteurianum DSM 525 = ATCC 6013]|uniref:DJ-1 family protein n=1 Tax=Clostridium pasteurianum DSM 525 = ATCC 6013 TaxID=1262449 RepID=A0A0H3J4H3_CLOPA|nr:DJ-1 family glyoxalase III [Clostridium pasteurianum]AJA47812.1 DJ-1 family protein [Clostridium pasteurianum DSM 525 = ATCC 6013]AJA51800.1 DJ-1 family protein [Clostridium pasteurianum DSM 525 = ATCC 6013]AOZ75104.1 thiamine biosynthesis protein ThiJ [Clostridium pasteurianum DSM 525 = ATCC 6013]AOZ78899.1 thiamine biosynthesis protein ThiJ [Clostridium pasteurianum]ELP59713.1 thij/PfpI family protein [Clostridium pasteurianum DSM 525 = ATCC 6013]
MTDVLLFIAEGFEEIEALTVVDILRRANIKCDTCSLQGNYVKGAHGIEVKADKSIEKIDKNQYGAVVLPGGMPGAKNLKENKKVIEIVQSFYNDNKIVSAICAAPVVLKEANVHRGNKITSYPSFKEELLEAEYLESIVAEDKNLITSRGPATAIYFGLKLAEKIAGKDAADKLREEMLLNFVEKNR